MRNDIANRHRGDLGGRFTDGRLPAGVTVSIDALSANKPIGQHLAWMLLNLLARQADEIHELALIVPEGIAAADRLSPLIPPGLALDAALRAGVRQINPAVLHPQPGLRTQVAVRIGPGPLGEGDLVLAAGATGWAGYVGQAAAPAIGDGANPVGAYVAACLCAGEIFKFVRAMRPDSGDFIRSLWLDVYTLRVADAMPPPAPDLPDDLPVGSAILAGVGAVANGLLHTLYPLGGLRGDLTLLDGDPEGITDTNLNRYVLFGLPHIAALHLKASTAAALFGGRALHLLPVDDSWQAWRASRPDLPLDLVLSAVDKNSARHAIQDALPRVILGASTNEMRAQINRYDVFAGGPCLRCRNPVEVPVADDVVIERLRECNPAEREAEARRVGVDHAALELFLADPLAHCGMITSTAMQKFSGGADEAEWAVGFVSVMAGVLLAGEYLKLNLDPARTALDAARNTFRFQFWRPAKATVNTIVATPPEQQCRCQSPSFQRVVIRRAAG